MDRFFFYMMWGFSGVVNTDPYNCQLLMTPSSLVVRVAAGFTAEMMKGGNGTTLARVNSEKLGNGLELGSQVSLFYC